MKQQREEKESEKKQRDIDEAEKRNVRKLDREFNESMRYLHQNQLTTEQIEERERNIRFQNRYVTKEFFNHVLNIDIFNQDSGQIAKNQIPQSFYNGKEYIESFFPAFCDEMKGQIYSALHQNDMSSHSIVELRLFTIQHDFGYLTPGDEKKATVSFYQTIKQDDLIIIIPFIKQDFPSKFSD